MFARAAQVLLVVMLAACAAPGTIEPLQPGQWPERLPLLRWRQESAIGDGGTLPGVTAGSSDEQLEAATLRWLRDRSSAWPAIEWEVRALAMHGQRWVWASETWCGIATAGCAWLSIALAPDGAISVTGDVGRFEVVLGSMAPAASESQVRKGVAAILTQLGEDPARAADVSMELRYFPPRAGGDELIPGWFVAGARYVDARIGDPGTWFAAAVASSVQSPPRWSEK
ncbi:MAG: hypothetical protein H6835_04460 [Planctomycetes bacterium]|nr:hypothetical protein [Planctomycetota bacterium]